MDLTDLPYEMTEKGLRRVAEFMEWIITAIAKQWRRVGDGQIPMSLVVEIVFFNKPFETVLENQLACAGNLLVDLILGFGFEVEDLNGYLKSLYFH
jgi:hypothetical protein